MDALSALHALASASLVLTELSPETAWRLPRYPTIPAASRIHPPAGVAGDPFPATGDGAAVARGSEMALK